MSSPLEGQVALVVGATRAAGRGIARELAAAGAKVWCTGRSTRGAPATPGRPETIEETVELIEAAGGTAIAARVDHTEEAEVEALAARVKAEDGRLDILVNDIWGGDDLIDWGAPFWAQDMAAVRTLLDRAVLSHWITARYFAPLMVEANRGLIVEVTDGDEPGYRGHLTYDFLKAGAIRLAYGMAWDLARTRVTALALSPGFLRSEAMLERFGVTEETWRDAAARNPEFAFSETPHYVGRAVAALAADPQVRRKSGGAYSAGGLAEEYGFTDLDGAQPNFWRSVLAGVATELASAGQLPPAALRLAAARYQKIHLSPAHSQEARALADRLGWSRLPAGLQPVAIGG
ncbi:MAG TPA: SDR family oxidoreductase [Caulobacteraceae bacterium]|jgi:NAD(P)-dependent dehydrogenase (short-subunit alcohol dehydrogenase family)|nr:SDR family oxidoreductase [Caulobacteraceae bacterium]